MRWICAGLKISIDIAAFRAAGGQMSSNTVLIWVDLPGDDRHDCGVSLSQIRYFVAVAEEGNVGRAAQRLHVAQPPVSRQIRALEDEIGTALFERTPRGMRLLPSGVAFLGHARQILEAVERASAAARDARQR